MSQIQRWQEAYVTRRATLEIVESNGARLIVDSRFSARPETHVLSDRQALMLGELDAFTSPKRALAAANKKVRGHLPIDEDEADAMLARFAALRWTDAENGVVLSLVLDRSQHQRVIDRKVLLMLNRFGFPVEHVAPADAVTI